MTSTATNTGMFLLTEALTPLRKHPPCPAVNLPFFGRTGSVCAPRTDPVVPYLGQDQPAFFRSSIASLWISGEANA